MSSFRDLGVPAELADSLAARGITAPFPIQAATLPDALAGRDVCGTAPTGSGKTLAFGSPLVARISRRRASPAQGPRARPDPRARRPGRATSSPLLRRPRYGPSAVAIYGGVGYGPAPRAAQGRRHPRRLPRPPRRPVASGDLALDEVELVVLDEADRMADMGFLPEVSRMLDAHAADRQTLLFSATLDGDVDVLDPALPARPGAPRASLGDDEPGDVAHALLARRTAPSGSR